MTVLEVVFLQTCHPAPFRVCHPWSYIVMHGCWACRTIADHVKFVPYGKSVNDDPERIQYMTDMKGYCKKRLLPCFDVYEQTKGSLPKHLAEVTIAARDRIVAISDSCVTVLWLQNLVASQLHEGQYRPLALERTHS